MAKKEKLFRLTIELEEVVEEGENLFPLFTNGQICSGINQIQSTLDNFSNQLKQFIDHVLIPNQKKRSN